jgi:nucleoid-associated protein YgaU
MGKVEKVIVLSVLFLIAMILVVSLTVEDPLQKNRVARASEGNGTAAQPVSSGGTALLSSNVGTAPTGPVTTTPNQPQLSPGANAQPNAAGTVAGLPAGAALKTSEGLEDSYVPDMKFYTWKEGDSYRLIAHRYYGDWTKLTLLRKSNEGRVDVKPGDRIHVPVFDTEAQVETAALNAPLAQPIVVDKGTAKNATKSSAKNAKSSTATNAGATGGGKMHTVTDGESLWKIAKKELGNGSRWKEIYEANKDVLASPEAVKKGMKLRIP